MKVSRLPVDPGPAAWNALLPELPLRASLDGAVTADWLIIGAGFAGLSAARRLAEINPTDKIVVLEASRVAEGASGRNSGFMIDVPHDLTSSDYGGGRAQKELRDIRLNRAGIDYALQAKARFSMSDEAIVQSGKVNGAITARGVDHNSGYAKHLDLLSEPYEMLDAAAMQELTGTRCYQQGLYSPGTVLLQPALYTRMLASGIESNRAHIFENSAVLGLERAGPDWMATTQTGSIVAPNVVISVNGHLESFGYSHRQLVHVYTYGSMTRALTSQEIQRLGGQPNWALTPADSLGTTVRRISGCGGDRVIIRNRATYEPKLEVDEATLKSAYRQHEQSFRQRFPMLSDVTMEYRWGGRLCLSMNNVPVFGEIDAGLYSACCQNGLGTAKGTIAGKLVAELASKQPSALLEDQLADDKPTRLPPQPLTTLGAKARLRWSEFRAGKEL